MRTSAASSGWKRTSEASRAQMSLKCAAGRRCRQTTMRTMLT
jgi:hypothetical protein